MKKGILGLLLLLAVYCLAGCEEVKQETSEYVVYRINGEGTKLVQDPYKPQSEKSGEMIQELIGKLMETPERVEEKSAIPKSVQITGAVVQDKNLQVEFSASYAAMGNIEEVLCRCAVVKTLVQVPDVDTVTFSVGGDELKDAQGTVVGPMGADSFIDAGGEGINSYQYAALTLYFADESGKKLVKEMRNVHYSSNNTLEKVVVEQILEGPANTKLLPVVNAGAKILSVIKEQGLCTINFDSTFNQAVSQSPVDPTAAVYSIVDAVCDTTGVKQVQIQIDGKTDVKYLDTVDISQPFEPSREMLSKTDRETEKLAPSVGVDQMLPK